MSSQGLKLFFILFFYDEWALSYNLQENLVTCWRRREKRSGTEEMEESCNVCRKWRSHVYWSHMDPTNVKFFVKMEASFRQNLVTFLTFSHQANSSTSEMYIFLIILECQRNFFFSVFEELIFLFTWHFITFSLGHR